MPEQTASLEQRVGRLLALLDAMDVDSLIAMVTDDIQSVDEISCGWSRGREAVESYLSQLKGSVSDVHSRMSDAHEAMWGDVGLVTFVLDQTYTMDGQQQTISARRRSSSGASRLIGRSPSSIPFRSLRPRRANWRNDRDADAPRGSPDIGSAPAPLGERAGHAPAGARCSETERRPALLTSRLSPSGQRRASFCSRREMVEAGLAR
jgi:hypothetical protein